MASVARAIGRRVATLRFAAQLTQVDLAKRIGSSGRVISRIENGAEMPSLSRLAELARALAVPVRELLGEPAPENPRDAEIAELVALLRSRPLAEVERIARVVRALID